MKFLESTIFIINVIFWLLGAAFLLLVAWQFGLVAFFCFLLFLLFYYKAEYFIISRLDKFVDSEWQIFRVKLSWANGQAIAILIVVSMVVGVILDKS